MAREAGRQESVSSVEWSQGYKGTGGLAWPGKVEVRTEKDNLHCLFFFFFGPPATLLPPPCRQSLGANVCWCVSLGKPTVLLVSLPVVVLEASVLMQGTVPAQIH